MKNYIVFDFETTGFKPQEDRITQMSAGRVENGEMVDLFNRYVKIDIKIPEKITELTGITNELLDREGIDEKQALQELSDFMGKDLPLLGHNSLKFDRVWLNYYLEKHGFEPTLNHRHFDTAALYKAKKMGLSRSIHETHFDFGMKVMNTPVKGLYFRLTLCCEELGIDVSAYTAHRSDSDIMMTHLVYQHFYKEFLKKKQ